MNTRQRTLIRSRCNNGNFNGFSVARFLMDCSVPGKNRDTRRRYIAMMLKGKRKYSEALRG